MYSNDLIIVIWGIEHKERGPTCSSSCSVSIVQYFFTFNLSLRFIFTKSLSQILLFVKSVNIFIWSFYFRWLIKIYFLLIVLKINSWIWVSCNFYYFFSVLLKFIIKIAFQSFLICSVVTLTKIQLKDYPIIRFSVLVIELSKSLVMKNYLCLYTICKNFLFVFDLTHLYFLFF